MGEFYTKEHRAAIEKEMILARERSNPVRRVILGERFSIVPRLIDSAARYYDDKDDEHIRWTSAPIAVEGFSERSLIGDVWIEQDVAEHRPANMTLDGTYSAKPLIIQLMLDGVSRSDARRLGCYLYFNHIDGSKHSIDLFGDTKREENAIYFHRQKGITDDMNPRQLTARYKKGETLISAIERLDLEAEFY